MATIELSLSSIKNNTTGRKQIRLRFYHGKRVDQRAKTGIPDDQLSPVATRRKHQGEESWQPADELRIHQPSKEGDLP